MAVVEPISVLSDGEYLGDRPSERVTARQQEFWCWPYCDDWELYKGWWDEVTASIHFSRDVESKYYCQFRDASEKCGQGRVFTLLFLSINLRPFYQVACTLQGMKEQQHLLCLLTHCHVTQGIGKRHTW